MQTAFAGHSSENCVLASNSSDALFRFITAYPVRRKKSAAVVVSGHNSDIPAARATSSECAAMRRG